MRRRSPDDTIAYRAGSGARVTKMRPSADRAGRKWITTAAATVVRPGGRQIARAGPRASGAKEISMTRTATALTTIALVCAGAGPAPADVITDWDERAVAFVTPKMPPPATERALAMVHV